MKKTALTAPALHLRAAAALALLVALGLAREARAQWTQPAGSSNVYKTDTNGNVGIGTTAPAGALEVNRAADGFTDALVLNPSTGAAATARVIVGESKTGGKLLFLQYFNSTYLGSGLLRPGTGFAGTSSGATGGLLLGALAPGAPVVFTTGGVGTANERMRIDSAGLVSIGTPAQPVGNRLHVEGHVSVNGNISAKYQDVAEWVPTTQELRAGTVVVLDPARSNHVLASAAAYDTSVAGVVSARPGLILGEGGEGRVMVATTGRVRVRVDATRGPIRIGDLLVTSDVPGVAMRSEPITVAGRRIHAPGTIIGKALEPLSGGGGEILVLLSLQ